MRLGLCCLAAMQQGPRLLEFLDHGRHAGCVGRTLRYKAHPLTHLHVGLHGNVPVRP